MCSALLLSLKVLVVCVGVLLAGGPHEWHVLRREATECSHQRLRSRSGLCPVVGSLAALLHVMTCNRSDASRQVRARVMVAPISCVWCAAENAARADRPAIHPAPAHHQVSVLLSHRAVEARAACRHAARHCGRRARVRLLGFSLGGGGHGDSSGDICLVYELGTLGSLADVLRRC